MHWLPIGQPSTLIYFRPLFGADSMEWSESWTDVLHVPRTVRAHVREGFHQPELLAITDLLSHSGSAGQPSTLIYFRALLRAYRMDWSGASSDVLLGSRAIRGPVLEVFQCLELPTPAVHTHRG